MTRDDILNLAREAGITDVLGSWCQECGCTDDMPVHLAGLVEDRAAAAEREDCIAKIQAGIDHAYLNELRLAPRFGRSQGDIAVRAGDLEAALDAIRSGFHIKN